MNGKIGIFGQVMDLAQRVGPVFGCIMGLLYAAAYAGYWFEAHTASNFAQVCCGLGGATFALGMGRGQKKQTDIMVASEAEKRLDPKHPMSSTSDVPQIQREIDAQIAGTSKMTDPQP